MKTIITVLIVFCALTTHAQEWRKYHKNDFYFYSSDRTGTLMYFICIFYIQYMYTGTYRTHR